MNVEELRRALHDEATLEPVDVDQAVSAVLRRGRRHRLRRRLAVGVVTAGLVVSGVVLLRQDRPSDEVVTALPPADTSTVATGADAGPATADVPDVRGLSVDAARSQLEDAGFALSIVEGDPTADDATVSAQAPPGGTPVPYASTVGVRTALVNDGVCAGLDVLPERTGDALQLAQEASFTDAIQAAAQAAREPLLTAIEAVLAEMQAGRDLSTAGLEVARALDTIAIHRDACATR